jgi:hypothetical protein
MNSSDMLFTYNPARFRHSFNVFAAHDTTNPAIRSVVDYKYPGGQLDRTLDRDYQGGSAMRKLETDATIIFPGGVYPSGEDVNRNKVFSDAVDQKPDGYTNMGGSLRVARNNLSVLTAGGIPAFNMVILLSDGLPNIRANWSGTGGTEYYSSCCSYHYAKKYAETQANELKKDGVRICTIFYETRGASGNAFLRDKIASSPSTKYHFNASNEAELNSIFQQILLTFPYVLVE